MRLSSWALRGLIVFAIFMAIWLKVRIEAGRSYEQAERLENKGEVELAIICYRRTIRWYSPGSEPVDKSVERLWHLGQTLETQGKPVLALLAYRGLRSALLGVRSVYQPYSDRIDPAEDRIAILMAHQEVGDQSDDRKLSITQHHRKLLDIDHAPSVVWSIIAIFSFFVWCFSLFSFASKGFEEETGKMNKEQAIRWLGLNILSFSLWLIGLFQA